MGHHATAHGSLFLNYYITLNQNEINSHNGESYFWGVLIIGFGVLDGGVKYRAVRVV